MGMYWFINFKTSCIHVHVYVYKVKCLWEFDLGIFMKIVIFI